jgi:hypothetical protein
MKKPVALLAVGAFYFLSTVAFAERPDLFVEPTYQSHFYTDESGKPKEFHTGVLAHARPRVLTFRTDAQIPATFDINDYITKVMKMEPCPVYDQGQCGSCVYNATNAALCQLHRARGKDLPVPSRQWVMDCAQRQWMCGGSLFEYVAKGIVAKGGVPAEDDYPYQAMNQSCQGTPALQVPVKSYEMIDPTAQSISFQLAVMKKPVAVTIGADNAFTQYRSGIYNTCTSTATNHQVVAEAYDCETSIDIVGGNKYCKFNSQGYPVNGDGWVKIRNSWNKSWGDNGYIKMRWLGRSGNKCNNVAEEAGVLDTGDAPLPPTPPTPVSFTLESSDVVLRTVVQPDAGYSADDARKALQAALNALVEE